MRKKNGPIGRTSQGEAVENARTIRIRASWAEQTEKNTEENLLALIDCARAHCGEHKLSLIGYIEYDSCMNKL